jgi:hypothetical protein
MTDDFVALVSSRYQELFERITGKTFQATPEEGEEERIKLNVENYLATLG